MNKHRQIADAEGAMYRERAAREEFQREQEAWLAHCEQTGQATNDFYGRWDWRDNVYKRRGKPARVEHPALSDVAVDDAQRSKIADRLRSIGSA